MMSSLRSRESCCQLQIAGGVCFLELLLLRLDEDLERERLLVLFPRLLVLLLRLDEERERLPAELLLLLDERLPLLARELLDFDFDREPDDFVAT